MVYSNGIYIIKEMGENEKEIINKTIGKRLAACVLICLNVFLQWLCIEASMCSINTITHRFILNNIISLCTVVCFNFVLVTIINRRITSLFISDIITAVLAIGNHYVYVYHGSPLRISEVKNLTTALNVISGYDVSIDHNAGIAILFFLLELGVVVLLKIFFGKSINTASRKRSAVKGGICLLLLTIVFSTDNNLKPQIGWSWAEAANHYGYSACLIEDTIAFVSRIEMPEGYSYTELERLYKSASNDHNKKKVIHSNELPDIILILNETFYDPMAAEDLALKTDVPYLPNYNYLESALKGLAAVPYTGTNSSEYELLTSNSMSIINPSAPFNYFSMTDANSIVTYLEKLGYETWAMHDAASDNYSRDIAYPAMGFDHVVFRDFFAPIDQYGNRYVTDSSDYRKLEEAYESSGENPRFIYMLSYQNHGGYEQNDDSYDLVHCLNDYGNLTDDMNEFLTSIQMSDVAIKELIDYFSKSERNVIVAMVGDHPPAFVTDGSIPYDESIDTVNTLRRRMTPYLIWCNYKNPEKANKYISLVDLIPMVLKEADLPLSIYYEHLLDIQKSVPVRIYDKSIGRDNTIIDLSEYKELKTKIDQYYYMEYNNCLTKDKRLQGLFEPMP